jgi:hypothetical protein
MITMDLCSLYQSLCKFFAKDNITSFRLQVPGFSLLAGAGYLLPVTGKYRSRDSDKYVKAFCRAACKLLLSCCALATGNW